MTVLGALGFLFALTVSIAVMISFYHDSALDDAYITYIYAQNLAEGVGLRYNISDALPTEGSSSMLQTLLTAVGFSAGIDPLTFNRSFNIGLFAIGALIFAAAMRKTTGLSYAITLSVVAVLSSIPLHMPETYRHLAKGLETIMFFYLHAGLFAWGVMAASRPQISRNETILGGVLAILLILSRPEGFVLAFGTLGAVGLARLMQSRNFIAEFRALLPVGLIAGLFLLAYFAWKIFYFGDIYPTAYWVKSNNQIFGSNGTALPGLEIMGFFLIFRWGPLAAVAFWLLWMGGHFKTMRITAVLLLPSLIICLLYMRAIHEAAGGFRYGYPMMAPLFVIGAIGLANWARQVPWPRAALLVSGAFIAATLMISPFNPKSRLIKNPVSGTTQWVNKTPALGGLTPLAKDMADTGIGSDGRILLSAAGIIPFISGFEAIDWLGLNDEQLSGKYPMSIQEVRTYLNDRKPDMAMSIFPPASPGATSYKDDPAFNSFSVQATLNGRGVKLFKFWDQDTMSRMVWSQMAWFRDNTEFAACYELIQRWVVFAYVAKDSPHYDKIKTTLSNSERQGCDRWDMLSMYNTDPRE